MDTPASVLPLIKKWVLACILFLFPLFFLPFTQEYFATSKFYLLGFGALFLLILSTGEFILSKKLVWQKRSFDNAVILFLTAVALSTVIASPNKIQALLNPTFGLVSVLSLSVLYFYYSRHSISSAFVYTSSLVLSLITIIFFFQPFAKVTLPPVLQFLKNPFFTPTGTLFDAMIFLGFVSVYAYIMITKQKKQTGTPILPVVTFVINLVAISMLLFQLLKNGFFTTLTPTAQSWYAGVEVLKQPISALFGVGVDNYSAMFTRIKDFAYNQSAYWQIGSFTISRSTLLHVLTETGLFGFIGLLLLLISLVRSALLHNSTRSSVLLFGFVVFLVIVFPPSYMVFFLLFISLAGAASLTSKQHHSTDQPGQEGFSHLDLSSLLPLYLGTIVLSFALVVGAGYLLGRAYASEISFKKSIDGVARNNVKEVYENMRNAIILNPAIEKYRANFADVNLIIANNIASKATATKDNPNPQALTEQERQTVSQAIQAAIEESKATVALNSQKAENWVTLARIYRNILGVAQGADAWTTSSYQRAIVLDPQNPTYRIDLGGVLYGLKNYDEALKLFEQAVSLKPDFPNAHYNLAWTAFQKQDYKRAALEMQNVVALLDSKKQEGDYKKAQKDLEEFKKMLPPEESASQEAQTQPQELAIPTPPQEISPKIELPKTASPEAQ